VRNAAEIITSSGPTFNVIQEPGALADDETTTMETTTGTTMETTTTDFVQISTTSTTQGEVTTQPITTTTEEVEEDTPVTVVCPQDVVCMALDVSGSMTVRTFAICFKSSCKHSDINVDLMFTL